jgi:hypothetical protein
MRPINLLDRVTVPGVHDAESSDVAVEIMTDLELR